MSYEDPPPFSVKVTKVEKPTGWAYGAVTVHDDAGREIGAYERNYFAFGDSTFCPFHLHDRWWALYSKDYTATRIMTLPECEDWCGEDSNPHGFCPVEYYVPRFRPGKWQTAEDIFDVCIGEDTWFWNNLSKAPYHDVGEPEFCPFGLIAGCIWGEDTSWKVEWLDLSGLPERKFVREPRFGYVELLDDRILRESIDMSGWTPESLEVGVIGKRWQSYETGISKRPDET